MLPVTGEEESDELSVGSVSLSPSGEQGIINGSAKLLGEERTKTAQKVDALVVWKASKLIGSEKLPFLRILLPAPVAVRPIILAGAGYVNRLVAQHLAPPFSGRQIVAAEEKFAVAVGCDGFPIVFVKGFYLRDCLQDDGDADASAAHGADEGGEAGDPADVGELVEHAVQRNIQSTAWGMIGLINRRFKKALVEKRRQIGECRVRVADDDVDDRRLFADGFEVHRVVGEDLLDAVGHQSCQIVRQGRDDAFLRFSRPLLVCPILGTGEGEPVQGGAGRLIILVREEMIIFDFLRSIVE